MIDWLPVPDTFPSLSQINSKTLLEVMRDPIDFVFSPLFDFVITPLIDLYKFLRTFAPLQTAIETINLGQYIGVWRAIDPRNQLEKWEGMDNIGRLVLLGCEVGIEMIILWDLVVFVATPAAPSTPVDHSTPATTVLVEDEPVVHNNEASMSDHPSLSQAETSSEFKSTSTNRTNHTITTASTNENDLEQHRTVSPYLNPPQEFIPPDHILQQYIRPRYSFWPPYYLQAFYKAQESVQKEDNTHADAPPSSGTRGNKDGCVGKIVLDKKVVKKDLKNGVVGLRKGVQMGNWEGIKWK